MSVNLQGYPDCHALFMTLVIINNDKTHRTRDVVIANKKGVHCTPFINSFEM